MQAKRGLVILYEDLDDRWVDLMKQSGLDTLALHKLAPKGGNSLDALLTALNSAGGRDVISRLENAGINVEYELHSMEWLLPRSLFAGHPGYFRARRDGVRDPDYNMCPSDAQALDIISQRAYELAGALRQKSHRYHLWLDDAADGDCCCEHCRTLSKADQYVAILRAILRGLRRYDPAASVSFLAYGNVLEAPGASADLDGIFLEFAPMDRDHDRPMTSDEPRAVAYRKLLASLLTRFDAGETEVLEYWLDDALYSGYRYPPAKVPFNAGVCDADVSYYSSLGIRDVTTFASFIGKQYFELWGEPPVRRYGEILNKYVR